LQEVNIIGFDASILPYQSSELMWVSAKLKKTLKMWIFCLLEKCLLSSFFELTGILLVGYVVLTSHPF